MLHNFLFFFRFQDKFMNFMNFFEFRKCMYIFNMYSYHAQSLVDCFELIKNH